MPTALAPHPSISRRPGPIVLCILDGVGLGSQGSDDAFATARTPNLDHLLSRCPHLSLKAHGKAVGLPSDADMGNSEVGHNAMGAGRVFAQGASLVNRAFESGAAFDNEVWRALIAGQTLHLIGLVSDGNVHSHIRHVERLVERAAVDGVSRLRLHVLTDGRDVAARSALQWIEPLQESFAHHRSQGRDYRIASGGGRMVITMDRYEADWDMIARGWATHVRGEGRGFHSASEAVETAYAENPEVNDQHIPPFVIVDEDERPVGPIRDGDAVLFFNFRGDRAIEIARAFEDEQLDTFARGPLPRVTFAGMMRYDGDLDIPKHYLVSPPTIDRTVGEYLVTSGRRTFACSETQKFGHVTYFFNGNRSGKFDDDLEVYHQVPSDSRPFEERPWMRSAEITDAVIDAIRTQRYDHVRLNFANGDMVGHTGNLEASRIAMEAVDLQLGRLVRAIREADGVLLVTADHGNAEEMWTHKNGILQTAPDGSPLPKTSHTLNPVPFAVMDPRHALGVASMKDPGIASIGATVLSLCGLQPPDDYAPALIRLAHDETADEGAKVPVG